MTEDMNRFNPDDFTEDGINEITEDFIEEFDLLLSKYKPYLGINQYFQIVMKDFLGFKGIFQQRNGEVL